MNITSVSFPKKIKDKWLKALRSGEYGQARGTLTDGEGNFCCLGVLQHCVSGGKVETFFDKYNGTEHFSGMPSKDWYDSVGIKNFITSSEESELTKMNDGAGAPRKRFKTIANWIEKNIPTH